ncbi:MAG: hypothetical protein HYR55_10785 [Acidobacteria bacterium]|nr:hypothetical protein [Acidobacteriota bacterium]MBI3655753.1 hypothetical protein [Acidobacteriota bacterium]
MILSPWKVFNLFGDSSKPDFSKSIETSATITYAAAAHTFVLPDNMSYRHFLNQQKDLQAVIT